MYIRLKPRNRWNILNFFSFLSRDNPTRYSNGGGHLQSILTVATSCGSSKNSLSSMQLLSSQHQATSKLSSPSTSADDRNQRSHNSEIPGNNFNGLQHASNGELEVLNEVENENEINIPGSCTILNWLMFRKTSIKIILLV